MKLQKKKESSFSLLSEEEPYKLTTFGTKNTLSTSRRMVSESQEKINKQENVNNLLKVIKDKNIKLYVAKQHEVTEEVEV